MQSAQSSNRPVPITQLLDSQLINDYLQSPSLDRRDYTGRRGESMDVPNRSDLNVVREGGRNRSESVDQLSQRPKLGFLDKPEDLAASRQASASSILNSYSDSSKGVATSQSRSRTSLGKYFKLHRCLKRSWVKFIHIFFLTGSICLG